MQASLTELSISIAGRTQLFTVGIILFRTMERSFTHKLLHLVLGHPEGEPSLLF